MYRLNQFLAWFKARQQPTANAGLLSWFSTLQSAWSAQKPGSATPAPISSTPADKTPAASPAPSQSETGEALIALLDLIARRR